MKMVYGSLFCLMISQFFCFSGQQEFIKKPKEKKGQITEQQWMEINADNAMKTNKIAIELNSLNQEILLIEKTAMSDMVDCCDGQKVIKEHRAAAYKKAETINLRLDELHNTICAAKQALSAQ